VLFRKGGQINVKEKCFYNYTQIEVVDKFNYFGVLFNFNGKSYQTQKHVAGESMQTLLL